MRLPGRAEILNVIGCTCLLLFTFFWVEGCATARLGQTLNDASTAKQLFEDKYQTIALEEDQFVHPPHYPYDNVAGLTMVLEGNASHERIEIGDLLYKYSSTERNPSQAAKDLLLYCFGKYGATVVGVYMLQGGDHPMDLREVVQMIKERGFRTTALYKFRYEGPRDYNAPDLPLKKGAIPVD